MLPSIFVAGLVGVSGAPLVVAESGHATVEDLRRLITALAPKQVPDIHRVT
jgi:mRNA degradation ribonuclease J1/J2